MSALLHHQPLRAGFSGTWLISHLPLPHLPLQLDICPHSCPVCRPPSPSAAGINSLLAQQPLPAGHFDTWLSSIMEIKERFPMWYPKREDVIVPQWAIEVRCLGRGGHAASTRRLHVCAVGVMC